jgi:transformation/transcription domain-associated protein
VSVVLIVYCLLLYCLFCRKALQKREESFNRELYELYIEFMNAQCKTLSFIAFLVRVFSVSIQKEHDDFISPNHFQETLTQHSGQLVKGVLQMLSDCPSEAANVRKDIFNSCRHLFGSDLRVRFVPHLAQFFDETIMIGNGWTANETLR